MIRPIAMGLFVAVGVCAVGPSFAEGPIATPLLGRTFLEWYAMGGTAMHVLLVCSTLVVGVGLERSWALRSAVTLPSTLAFEIERALEVGNRGALKELCAEGPSSLSRVAAASFEGEATVESVEAAGAFEAHRVHQNLPLLASLGNLATMIGLLGTVLGMIEAFDMIASVGSGDARVVAGGIFRALITTAAGLTVAVVAVGSHALFVRRATRIVSQLEQLSSRIFHDCARGRVSGVSVLSRQGHSIVGGEAH